MRKNNRVLITIGLLVVSLMLGSSLVYGYTNFWGYGDGQIGSSFFPFAYWSGCFGNPAGTFTGQWRDDNSNTGTFSAVVSGTTFQGHWFSDASYDTSGHISGYINSDTAYGTWSNPKNNPTNFGSFWTFDHEHH